MQCAYRENEAASLLTRIVLSFSTEKLPLLPPGRKIYSQRIIVLFFLDHENLRFLKNFLVNQKTGSSATTQITLLSKVSLRYALIKTMVLSLGYFKVNDNVQFINYIVYFIQKANNHDVFAIKIHKDAYMDKFKTFARTRSFEDRFLGKYFFQGEPSKPLFHSNNLLTIHNLYKYNCIFELFKLIKLRTPMSIYELMKCSERRENYFISLL